MKLKYYLRGLGIGIIVTTIILMISFSGRTEEMSDEEVIARASQLGMVMPEDEPSEAADDDAAQKDGADNQTDAPQSTADADTQAADAQDGQATANGQPDGEGELSAEDLLAQTQNTDGAGQDEAAADNTTEPDAAYEAPVRNAEGSFRLTIQKGDVCRVVCEKLAEGGVITDAEALRKYLFEIGYASNMSIGEYDIPYGATNEEIASILQEGPIE
ncbi:MAG: hypothetical protein J6K53_07705 [Roseburia sp.]|nr:hypothetical protein [Roseburia sp.]